VYASYSPTLVILDMWIFPLAFMKVNNSVHVLCLTGCHSFRCLTW